MADRIVVALIRYKVVWKHASESWFRNNVVVSCLGYRLIEFTQREQRYDLIADVVVKSSFSAWKSILESNGRYITTAFSPSLALRAKLVRGNKKMIPYVANPTKRDLIF